MTAQMSAIAGASGAEKARSGMTNAPASPFPAPMEDASEPRSRRMLLLERTMYRDGSVPFTSLFTVRLRGALSEPRLRQALAQVQAKHPLLRCAVEEAIGGSRFVQRRQPAAIPLRIVERSTDQNWEDEARREWLLPFGRSSDPLVRLVWLRGNDVHELMLVGHHCICDGPSGMALLRDCFAAYDDPVWEPDAYASLGGIDDLIPAELLRDRGFRFRVRRRSALFRLALLVKACRPPVARRANPGAMYFHRWLLDPTRAQRLVDRCREEDVTVLAAVVVAVVQAFRVIRGADALQHAYAMVNARRFMTQPHPAALFGVAPGVEIGIKGIPNPDAMPTSVFWERARSVRGDLTKRINRLGKQYYEYMAALENLHDQVPRLIRDTDAAPAIRHITFSNLGRLELAKDYRSFRIEHVFSPLVMVSPSPANTLVISSFGGTMEFAIISDGVSLPEAQARAVRERVMAILGSAAAAAGYRPDTDENHRMRGTATT